MKDKLEWKNKEIFNNVKMDFPSLIGITWEEVIAKTIISLRMRWYLDDN